MYLNKHTMLGLILEFLIDNKKKLIDIMKTMYRGTKKETVCSSVPKIIVGAGNDCELRRGCNEGYLSEYKAVGIQD